MSKAELVMQRDGGCLRPYGDPAWDAFDGVRTNKPVIVTVHQARNPDHHNKLWGIAAKVADFDPEFTDAEDAVDWVKEQIPNMHTKKARGLPSGTIEVRIVLRSISFASMDQIAFNRFYDRALWLWSERIGTDPETLLEQQAEAA